MTSRSRYAHVRGKRRRHHARCEWQRLAGRAMPLPTPDQIIGCLEDDLPNRFCNLKETDPEVELDAEEPEDD